MKISKYLPIVAIAVFLSSCNDNTDPLSNLTQLVGETGFSYMDSYDSWTQLKEQNGNSYKYQTTFTSWAGFGNTTEIMVENGVVTGRAYHEFVINDTTGEYKTMSSYIETSSNLGSNEAGAELMTIDELYSTCASEYLIVKKSENRIYFETDTTGLMTLCGYVPNSCADDCYYGIRIDSFDWIE